MLRTKRECSAVLMGALVFNNMRVGGPDRGGETVSERLPAPSQSVRAAVRWIC